MTDLENKQFLSFLTSQFDEGGQNIKIYQPSTSTPGFEFLGTNSTNFVINSVGNDVEIFMQDITQNKKILNVILPLAQCIEFLDYIYNAFKIEQKQHLTYYKNSVFIKEQLDFIALQLEQIPYQPISHDDKAFITIVNSDYNLQHELMIGMSYDLKENKNLIDVIAIPVFVAQTNVEKQLHTLMLPTWKLYKYPCLKDFVTINNSGAYNTQELLDLLEQHSPDLSKQLHYHMLETAIENKSIKSNKLKI